MIGIFLIGAAAKALASGEVSSEEEYCNLYGCDYDDIYERRSVREGDEFDDRFVCWDYDEY